MHSPCGSAGSKKRVYCAENAANGRIAPAAVLPMTSAGPGALLIDEGRIIRLDETFCALDVERPAFDGAAPC